MLGISVHLLETSAAAGQDWSAVCDEYLLYYSFGTSRLNGFVDTNEFFELGNFEEATAS